MATKTFWFYDVAVGSYGKLDEGTAPGQGAIPTKVTVTINKATSCGSAKDRIIYNATVTGSDCDANAPVAPNGSNGFRSLNPLTGTFAAGSWSVRLAGDIYNDAI